MYNLEDINFDFEHELIRIIIVKDIPNIKLKSFSIGPFKSNQEIELMYWVAEELVKSGLARYRDQDLLDMQKLSKIHWRDTIPTSRQVPSLPRNFYFMLRKFLKGINEERKRDPSKIMLYEKVLGLSKDIINCRVRKIISLAAISTDSRNIIENMAAEEIALYNRLGALITNWKENLIKIGDES